MIFLGIRSLHLSIFKQLHLMESSNLNDIIESNDIPLGEGLNRKRKVATSSPPPSKPSSPQDTQTSIAYPTPTKKIKTQELPDWWNNTIESTNKFLSTLRESEDLKQPFQNSTQTNTTRTVLLPLPPVGGLTSRFINTEKDGKIPCIKRDSFKPLKEFIERKEGLTYVHGPQGVGKSFALYHLYCTLSINPKNRVMYICDCAELNDDPFSCLIPALVAAFAEDGLFLSSMVLSFINPNTCKNFLFC